MTDSHDERATRYMCTQCDSTPADERSARFHARVMRHRVQHPDGTVIKPYS